MKADPQCKDVQFDPRTGALMATHVGHNEDPNDKKRYFGMPKHELEKCCQMAVFRMKGGHKMLFRNENRRLPNGNTATELDSILDDKIMDVHSITEDNKYTIRNGLNDKNNQLYRFYRDNGIESDCVCLYFHDSAMYNSKKMREQIDAFVNFQNKYNFTIRIKTVYCVVNGAENIDIYDVNIT